MRWVEPVTLSPEQEAARDAKSVRRNLPVVGANEALQKEYFAQLFGTREKWIDPKKDFCK